MTCGRAWFALWQLVYACTYWFLTVHLPVWCAPALPCWCARFPSLRSRCLWSVAAASPAAQCWVTSASRSSCCNIQPVITFNTFQLLLSDTSINLVLWMGHCIFLSLHFLSLMAVQRYRISNEIVPISTMMYWTELLLFRLEKRTKWEPLLQGQSYSTFIRLSSTTKYFTNASFKF